VKVAIHQPQYLPWLGYFEKIDSADVFIILDTVQFKKHEWQNRNRIRTKDGWQWLTVPIVDRFPEKIDCVQISDAMNWQRKHAQALRLHYGKAPHWEPLGPALLGLLEDTWTHLCDLNIAIVALLCEHLGITTPRILASSLSAREEPTDRLIDLCRAVGGAVYLAGQAGLDYMDLARFKGQGIMLHAQAYAHPEYPQRYAPFVSHMSVIDLLFNCGPTSLDVLRSGSHWEQVP
jgi:hypothetical protein